MDTFLHVCILLHAINDYVHVYIPDENIFQVIVDLLMAGSETTSTTLLWGLLYMILNPDIQTKCRQEISQVTSNNNEFRLYIAKCIVDTLICSNCGVN